MNKPNSNSDIGQDSRKTEKQPRSTSHFAGIPTGFSRLDALTSGLQNSNLIILAARPAMGKTALALNLARNAAVDHGIPTAIFSLEMSRSSSQCECSVRNPGWTFPRYGAVF